MRSPIAIWRRVAGAMLSLGVLAFTPLPAACGAPISGMNFWLDASDLSTFPAIGGGGGVNNWQDKSANGFILTNGGAVSTKPVRQTVAGYKLPVVHFDGGDTIGLFPPPTSATIYSGGVHTVFMVFTATKGGPEQDVFDTTPTGITRRLIYTDGTGINMFRGSGVGGDIANANYSSGDQLVFSAVMNGSSSATWINGANQVTGTISNTSATTTRVDLSSTINSNLFTGDIAEILVYNSVLSTADRQANEQYLIDKWLPEPSSVLLLFAAAVASITRRRRETSSSSISNVNRTVSSRRIPMSVAKCIAMLVVVAVSLVSATTVSAAPYEITVSSYLNNKVLRYNSGTTIVSTYSNGIGGLTSPEGLTYGPDGLVYVTGYNGTGGNKIYQYDPATNAFASVFPAPSGNLNNPTDIDFAGGKAYIVNSGASTHNVNRFNSDGSFDGTFVTPTGSLYRATFGPDGSYYVADYVNGIHKFTSTGTEIFSTFTNPFVPASALSGGASFAVDVAFGPDGNLYTARYLSAGSGPGLVTRINPTTGAVLDNVLTGLDTPYGMVFTPDNKLYLSSYLGDSVTSYNFNATLNVAWTGATTVMTSLNGLDGSAGIAFTLLPEPSSIGMLLLAAPTLMRRRRSI